MSGTGGVARLLFSIPPSQRARRLAEVISLDDGVVVLATEILVHVITDPQRRPFVGRAAVSLRVGEALLCHIVPKDLNVASQHVTEGNDFVLTPPRASAPDSGAVGLKRVVFQGQEVSKVLLVLPFAHASRINKQSDTMPLMHVPRSLPCSFPCSHPRTHMWRRGQAHCRETVQQTQG